MCWGEAGGTREAAAGVNVGMVSATGGTDEGDNGTDDAGVFGRGGGRGGEESSREVEAAAMGGADILSAAAASEVG